MSENVPVPPKSVARRQPRLLGAFAAVTAAAFVLGAGTMQMVNPARTSAQAVGTASATTLNAASAAAAPAGTVAAVAQTVGPAVVSVRTDQGLGSGVIYDGSGLILTNAHVVQDAGSITIGLVDGRHFAGKIVGADTGFDVAVIKIDGANLPSAPLGDQGDVQVGDAVVAIGNPYGFDHTLTTGVVSALNRPVSEGQGSYNQPMIQTDAAINPGNSGGPLLDISGRVIGITTLVAAPQGFPASGIGFAVPVDTAERIAAQLVQSGSVTHSGQPYLGVSLADINRPDTTPGFPNMPGTPFSPGAPGGRRGQQPGAQRPQAPAGIDHGALVGNVQANSAAAQAGVQNNDVITSFDNFDIYNPDELLQRLVVHKPGDQIPLTVFRNGQSMNLSITLGEAPVQS
jgi:S1-C subfamily serine protease